MHGSQSVIKEKLVKLESGLRMEREILLLLSSDSCSPALARGKAQRRYAKILGGDG